MAYFLGIDIGSRHTKGVLVDDNSIIDRHILPSGINYRDTAIKIRNELLYKNRMIPEDIGGTVATGHQLTVTLADEYVIDIRCTARGIHEVFPQARTIIDIQNQSSQVILINAQGLVKNFIISEKCAGGSGRFLEVVANVLRINLEEIGNLSLKACKPVSFTTGCAVFSESEAISRVAEGENKEDILAGVNIAIADKISALVSRVGMEEPCAVTGGGALNNGLVHYLENRLGIKLLIPDIPQFITALGAAVMARENYLA